MIGRRPSDTCLHAGQVPAQEKYPPPSVPGSFPEFARAHLPLALWFPARFTGKFDKFKQDANRKVDSGAESGIHPILAFPD
jgi:hypothetical protein